MNEAMMKVFMKALGIDPAQFPAMIKGFGEGLQKFSAAIERVEKNQKVLFDALKLMEAKLDVLEMNLQKRLPLDPDMQSVFPGVEDAPPMPRVVMTDETIAAMRAPQRQLTPEELQARSAA